MKVTRELWRNWKVLVALALLGALGLAFAQFVLRPQYRKWRTGVKEVPLAGATIAYRDIGEGSPVAVIITGMDCRQDSYYELQRGLSKTTRVLAYDRPGLGYSTGNSDAPTLDIIDRDLEAFLKVLHVPPPYLLIGHSLGGHIIRYYADKHPKKVAGLVFLDAPHEDWFRHIRETWSKQDSDAYFVWWKQRYESDGTEAVERPYYEKNCDMVRGVKIDPDIPVLMFTGNNEGHFAKTSPAKERDRQLWADMQAEFLVGVKDAKQIVDWEVGHFVHDDKPEMVLHEIGSFIERIRAKRPSAAEQAER